jgi:hypothetical protein
MKLAGYWNGGAGGVAKPFDGAILLRVFEWPCKFEG